MNGARFSIGQALAAGLRLPVRHPLAVLVWALALMTIAAASAAIAPFAPNTVKATSTLNHPNPLNARDTGNFSGVRLRAGEAVWA